MKRKGNYYYPELIVNEKQQKMFEILGLLNYSFDNCRNLCSLLNRLEGNDEIV